MDILFFVALALFVSFILGELFYRMHYPRIIGQVCTGIIFAIPFIHQFLPTDTKDSIGFIADLAIIFLLLLAGLEVDLGKLRRRQKETLIISLFSVLVPFCLGFMLMKALSYSTVTALVLGAALSLTAEGTTLALLVDLNALNTRIGSLMLGAGILDDLFEVLFLAVVLILSKETSQTLLLFPLKLLVFIGIVYVLYLLLPKIMRNVQKEHNRITTFSMVLIIGLLIATLSDNLTLGPVIGAFVAGVLINYSDKDRDEEQELVKELKLMLFSFIIPFFFINIGLNFSFTHFTTNIWLIILIVLFAIAGKLLGAIFSKPFTSLTWAQAHLLGWGMNSRGAIELVIVNVALQARLIPIEVYNGVVVMAIVTTLIFPFVLRNAIKRNRDILY